MKLISALALLLLFAIPSHAKVLIYKGTLKAVTTAPPVDAFPTVIAVYFLVDPDNAQYVYIQYYTKNGKHLYESSPDTIYITSGTASATKTLTAMCYGRASFTSASNFSEDIFAVVGANTSLKFTTMGPVQTLLFPKTFSGQSPFIDSGGSIHQTQWMFGLQSKATLDANDASQTISQAADALSAGLQKLGYIP